MDRRREAMMASVEAVGLYRELAAARPEAFNSDLARSLMNLSSCLVGVGETKRALIVTEIALKLHRTLAAACPEAFNADLVACFVDLSDCLHRLGEPEIALAALEEARIRSRSPRSFLPRPRSFPG